MRTGTRGAAGWSRVLSLAVLLAIGMAALPAQAQIRDANVSPDAGIAMFKTKFGYADVTAYLAARSLAYRTAGKTAPALAEGEIYWDQALDALRYYTGAAWATYAPGAGAGLSIDDAYTNGQVWTRDLSPMTMNDGTVGASSSFVLNRTAGTGAVLDLSNAGTGNDITGDLWSVSTDGEITAVGFTLGDSQSVNFGDDTDAILEWVPDATPIGGHLVLNALVDSSVVHWDTDQHGLDQKFWGDTATAGDGMFFDASAVELSFLKTAAGAAAKLLLGYDDILSLGDSSEFTLKYDDDTTATYLVGVAGEELYVGADGTGMDVVIYSDTAGSSAQFTYASDSLVLTNYTIGMGDDDPVKFGASDDVTILFHDGGGAPNDYLAFGGVGGLPIRFGVANGGLDVNLFDNGAAGVESLTWDAIDAVTNDSRLEFVHADAYFDDDSKIIMGTGATAAGDMTLNYTAANVLEVKQVVSGAGVDGTGEVKFGVDGEGVDVTFYGETAGDLMVWDQLVAGGTSALRFVSGPDLTGDADFVLTLGATNTVTPADGVKLTGGAGSMGVNGVAAGALVTFGGLADTDVRMTGAAGMVTFNAGDDEATFNGYDLTLEQEDLLVFGDGAANNGDVAVTFETSAAFPAADVLHIKPAAGAAAADQIVQFGTDGASNNVDVYFTADSAGDGMFWGNSDAALQFVDASIWLGDGTIADDAISFGASNDVMLYWDDADAALVAAVSAAGKEINFGDEDTVFYPDVRWHAGATMSVLYDEAAGNPVESHDDVPIALDQDSALYFDPTSASTPVDGFGIKGDGAAASDKLYVYALDGAATSGEVIVGHDGASFLSTDMTLWGSAGAESASLRWDASTSSLNFLTSTSNSWYANNAYIGWGNTQAAPDALVSFNGVDLLFDSGVADYNVQFGTDQANHKVSVRFGESLTKAITINGNGTSGRQIVYNTVEPVQRIYIPAASFGVGSVGTATWGKEDSAAGWTLDPNGTECVQTTWQPDLWVADAFNVRAVFTAGSSNNVVLTVSSVQVVPGTTASTDVDDPGVNKTLAVTDSVISETPTGDMWTVAGAKVDSSHWRPIVIEVCRIGGDGADNLVGDLVFMGLEMEVPRSYGD